jgi:16S rRNA (adenine1518-N6/adenine1519-N6)-dimethyltransferase
MVTMSAAVRLLGAGDIRGIADRLGVRPTKRLGQNFVVEQGSVRKIAALAMVRPGDLILEVGPGLGSLTLALLEAVVEAAGSLRTDGTRETALRPTAAGTGGNAGAGTDGEAGAASGAGVPAAGPGMIPVRLVAVEIDPVLANELPRTLAERAPDVADQVTVLAADALAIGEKEIGALPPTVLAANLPYNVAVPVVLHLLAVLPSLQRGVVMVQAEVADRMCAGPGSRVYGVPSAKLAWYAAARSAGTVPRNVFWPVPNVDSKLVTFTRRDPPPTTASREEVFAVIDAAFGQRRKTLRAALAGWAGSPAKAEAALRAAGVDPGARGEALTVAEFARIAQFSRT